MEFFVDWSSKGGLIKGFFDKLSLSLENWEKEKWKADFGLLGNLQTISPRGGLF
jgi:hypothetical protein